MTIQEIYELAIKEGIKADFRSEKEIKQRQERLKKRYEKMTKEQKEVYDKERLNNPYSDTRILYGNSKKEVKNILVGIDIGGEEILLAKSLKNIDLVISHHPMGIGLSGLDDVMEMQIDLMRAYGVPENIAEKLILKRIGEVARGISSSNHNRVVDMAKILDVPLMCIHTPCDNLAAKFVSDKIEKDKPVYVEDIMSSLREISEYKEAEKIGAGPKIFVGGSENRVGKVVLTEMAGGTEGAPEIYERLSQAGVGTVIGMHISEKHRIEAEKAFVNIVIAGHISSDSIGVNLFLDKLEEIKIKTTPCSGLIRISRNKK